MRRARFTLWTVALALALAGTTTPAAAISLNVDGNGLSAIEGDGKGFTTPQKVVTPAGDSQTIAMQDIRGGTLASLPPAHTETSLVGSATAAYGTLSGSLTLHAASNPGGHQAQTRASFVVSFDDTATVHSDALQLGVPVTLNFSAELASAVLAAGLPNYNHASVLFEGNVKDLTSGATASFSLYNANVGTYPASQMTTLDTLVGHELELTGRLTLGGELQIAFDETDASAAVDAGHTAHLFFNPSPESDVTLSAASGHSYLAPEPSALALMLLAGALAACSRARASRD